MAFRIRFREIESAVVVQAPETSSTSTTSEWNIELSTDAASSQIRLFDPFSRTDSFGPEPEKAVKWYLEPYINEPFETTKADFAAEAISSYGRQIAAQITECGLLPNHGDIELEITANDRAENSGRDLQGLHWEVLEDVRLWPASYKFKSVSVFRSVPNKSGLVTGDSESRQGKKFKILLVVSRPGQEEDLDYQLVSRCLVAIVEHVTRTNPDVNASLKVLRPPTWQAFKEHLQEYEYDLVHLDMHGQIKNAKKGNATAVLAFCKPDLLEPLKMKKDFKTGEEVGKELAKAGVKTVILNACESASFQHSTPQSNLAQVLLKHGVQSVLAMSWKVTDQAVENFMNAFYQCLLVKAASVQDAARISRMALMNSRSRRARHMHVVQLSDYIVPVLYTSQSTEPPGASIKAGSKGTIFSYLERALSTFKHISPTRREAVNTIAPIQQEFMGRDIDILSLEVLLSVSRVILLHGQGGCGKTELLRYVCHWWKASGWIKGSAIIDFGGDDKYSYWDLDDVLEAIGEQWGLDPENATEESIISKCMSGKYLLVFDSAEALDTPIRFDSVSTTKDLPKRLQSFFDSVTRDGSMVIISSRQETTEIANIKSERQKYHLTGLSVLDSVEYLQQMAIEPNTKLPKTYHRRENIDFLRRVAVLLEGNPAAIQMIVPEMKQANFDGETLLTKLLYGVCEINTDEWEKCRFVKTIYGTMLPSFINFDETLIQAIGLGIFWTTMPKDLTWFYWFYYLSCSKYFQEGSYANWISKEFQDIVKKQQMARILDKHWSGIETKMIKSGMMEHSFIVRKNGKREPCYHVHPIFTLISRSGMGEKAFKESKFAYIRQTVLWDKSDHLSQFSDIEWAGTKQHEDYLGNMRAIAMAWALDDGDLNEEYERMGISLFDLTYRISIDSMYVNQRQPKLFIPLIWKHVLRVHMLIAFVHNGKPTRRDMDSILSHSWTLCRLSTDEIQRSGLISSALNFTDEYRATGATLTAPQEFSWFQLRHAEAELAETKKTIYEAKELYERNLADDPSTTDTDMLNAIRRWQLQNLTRWAECVVVIAAREGTLDQAQIQSGMQKLIAEHPDLSRPGNISNFFTNIWTEHADKIATLTYRDQFSYAIEKEKEAVSKFGKLAISILDNPITDVFADLAAQHGLPPNRLFSLLCQETEGDTSMGKEIKAIMGALESGLRLVSGDNSAAASALDFNLQREALSSTSSTGWQSLADLHMQMYAFAVLKTDEPDYKKGLTHLEEWWKLHQGIDVPKKDLVYAHLKFATCYDGLKNIAQAAKSVLKVKEVIPTMTIKDVVEGDDVAGFSEWVDIQLADLKCLHAFLDPRAVFYSIPAGAAQLSWQERSALNQIMTKALEAKKAKDDCEKAMVEAMETIKKTRELYKSLATSLPDHTTTDGKSWEEQIKQMDESIERYEKTSKMPSGPSRFWLG